MTEDPANLLATVDTNASIQDVERALLYSLPEGIEKREIETQHAFAPGVYIRGVLMPAGTFVIGHEHKTEHFNIVLSGRAKVMMDGVLHQIQAPSIFVSKPGVRKVLFIEEDMRWATVHPTEATDLQVLEAELIEKSPAFQQYEKDLAALREHVERINNR